MLSLVAVCQIHREVEKTPGCGARCRQVQGRNRQWLGNLINERENMCDLPGREITLSECSQNKKRPSSGQLVRTS